MLSYIYYLFIYALALILRNAIKSDVSRKISKPKKLITKIVTSVIFDLIVLIVSQRMFLLSRYSIESMSANPVIFKISITPSLTFVTFMSS